MSGGSVPGLPGAGQQRYEGAGRLGITAVTRRVGAEGDGAPLGGWWLGSPPERAVSLGGAVTGGWSVSCRGR